MRLSHATDVKPSREHDLSLRLALPSSRESASFSLPRVRSLDHPPSPLSSPGSSQLCSSCSSFFCPDFSHSWPGPTFPPFFRSASPALAMHLNNLFISDSTLRATRPLVIMREKHYRANVFRSGFFYNHELRRFTPSIFIVFIRVLANQRR